MTQSIDLARRLAADFATRADQADLDGKMPPEDVAALRESGYLSLSIPREYGGAGLSMRDCIAAQLELSKGSGSTGLMAAMQMHVFAHAREVMSYPEEKFAAFCRAVVEEGAIFNSVASEPILGSPSRGGVFGTTATLSEDGSEWIINGHKNWVTGGANLTHLLVRLSIGEDVAVMEIPGGTPGLEWNETWSDSLSLRASESHNLLLKDVRVPVENLVYRRAADAPRAPENAWFPMVLSATYLGVAMAARDGIIRYALERVPTALGRPISTLPKIQRQIGEIDVILQAARGFLLDAAGDWTGEAESRDALLPRIIGAKYYATEAAITITDKVLRIAGGASITHALPFERYLRDTRAGLAHPPSGDGAYEIVGRAAVEEMGENEI